MKIPFLDERLVTMGNMKRMARRRGRRDGRAEKPAATSGKNSVPFISQVSAHFIAEGERAVSNVRKLLNERIYETLERKEQIVLLESRMEKVSQSIGFLVQELGTAPPSEVHGVGVHRVLRASQ